VNGGIEAMSIDGDVKAQTVNGGVKVSATGAAQTVNGSINTDFPITVQGRFGMRSAKGTIGGGGPDLSLQTVNGSINLKRASG
jgi:DUF4097 and DUF4098 domain-containing protein YvlB